MRKNEVMEKSLRAFSRTFDGIQTGLAERIRSENSHGKDRQSWLASTRTELQKKLGSFAFIPRDVMSVLPGLVIGYDYLTTRATSEEWHSHNGRFSFLDAGCGFGNIMMLALGVGFSVHGLEIDETSIKYAKFMSTVLGHNTVERWSQRDWDVKRQNILTYRSYGKFDFVYYYCPFKARQQEIKFEERVEDQMRVGALMMPVLKRSRKILSDKRFRMLRTGRQHSDIFEKISK